MGSIPQVNPNIILGGQQTQQPSALDSLARVLQIKSGLAQQALIPGQQQLQQQQVQEGQLKLQQTKDMNDAYKAAIVTKPDGTVGLDPDRVIANLGQGSAAVNIPAVSEGFTKMQKGVADLQKAKADLAAVHADNGGAIAATVQALPADHQPSALLAAIEYGNRAGSIDPASSKQYSDAITAAQQKDPSGVAAQQVTTQILNGLTQGSAKQRELATAATSAGAAKSQADTKAQLLPGELAAQKPALEKAQAEATLATAKANLVKDPNSYSAIVDDLKLPPALAGRTKAEVSFYISKGQIDQANRALDAAVETANAPDKAAAVASATAPIETARAVATEKATTPLKISQAVQTAKALRQGDLPAIAGVPPANINQVQGAASKLDTDYNTAKTAADEIANLLQMARGGNVTAGANVPLAGVGALNAVNGIKRINGAEIAQYGTAGSLIQKIQGKLGDWTEGKPIPDSVLKDMESLHSMLAQGAYQKYSDGLNALNLRSGAKYAPAFDAPKALGAKAPPAVGTVEGGYRFRGGDPGKQENWQKVQ